MGSTNLKPMSFLRTARGAAGMAALVLSLGSLTGLSYVGNQAYLAYQRDAVRASLDAAGKVLAHDQVARRSKLRAQGQSQNQMRPAAQVMTIAQQVVKANLQGTGLTVNVTNADVSLNANEMTIMIEANLISDPFDSMVPFLPGMFKQSLSTFRSETRWGLPTNQFEIVVLVESSPTMLRPMAPSTAGESNRCGDPGSGSWYAQSDPNLVIPGDPERTKLCKQSRQDVVAEMLRTELLPKLNDRGSSPQSNRNRGLAVSFVPYGETVNLYNDQYQSTDGTFSYRQRINEDRINFDYKTGEYPAHPSPSTWAGCVEVKPGKNTAETANVRSLGQGIFSAHHLNSNIRGADGVGTEKFWDVSYRKLPEGPGLPEKFLNAWQAPDVLSKVSASATNWNGAIGEVAEPVTPTGDASLVFTRARAHATQNSHNKAAAAFRKKEAWTPLDVKNAGYSNNPSEFYDDGRRPSPMSQHHNIAGRFATNSEYLDAVEMVLRRDPAGGVGNTNGVLGSDSPWKLFSSWSTEVAIPWHQSLDLTWYREHAHGESTSLFTRTKEIPRYMGHNQGCLRMPIIPLTYDFGYAGGWIDTELDHMGAWIDDITPVRPVHGLTWAGRVLSPDWNSGDSAESTRKPLWQTGTTLHRHIPGAFALDENTDPDEETPVAANKAVIWIASTDRAGNRNRFSHSRAATGLHNLAETRYDDDQNPVQHTQWMFVPLSQYGVPMRSSDLTTQQAVHTRNFGYGGEDYLYACRYSIGSAKGIDTGARDNEHPIPHWSGRRFPSNFPQDREAWRYTVSSSGTWISSATVVSDPTVVNCVTPRRPVVWCRNNGSGYYEFRSSVKNTPALTVAPPNGFSGADRIKAYLIQNVLGTSTDIAQWQVRHVLENVLLLPLFAGDTATSVSVPNFLFANPQITRTADEACPDANWTPILYCENHMLDPGGDPLEAGYTYSRFTGKIDNDIHATVPDGGAFDATASQVEIIEGDPRNSTATVVDVGYRESQENVYEQCGYRGAGNNLPEFFGIMPDPVYNADDGPGGPGLRRGDGLLIAGTTYNVRIAPMMKGHETLLGYSAYGRIRHQFTTDEMTRMQNTVPPGDFAAMYAGHLDSFAEYLAFNGGVPPEDIRRALRGPTSQMGPDGVPTVDDASLVLGYRTGNRFAHESTIRDYRSREGDAYYQTLLRSSAFVCRELRSFGVRMYGIRILTDQGERSHLAFWNPGVGGQASCFDEDGGPGFPRRGHGYDYPSLANFYPVTDTSGLADAINDVKEGLKQQMTQLDAQ